MPTIAIEFPWGQYHGTPWGRNVNEGVVDWPPEPWRLVRALYATWKARVPELPESVVAALLDTLAVPPAYLVPPHRVAHTRHYYPDAKHGPKGRGADTDKVLDTFAAVARGATLWAVWPGALGPDQRDALRTLCDHLTYLGRAESVCVARLAADNEPTEVPPGYARVEPLLAPGDESYDMLAAVRPLELDTLEVRPQRMRRSGFREPVGSRRVAYPHVAEAEVVRPHRRLAPQRVTAVRLRVTGKALPSPRAAVAVTDALRNAALSMFDPGGTKRTSVALFGKDRDGRRDDDHRHAHYLAFTSSSADRRALDTLAVWAPGGLAEDEVEALTRVQELRPPRVAADFRLCRLAVEASGDVNDVVPELCGTGSSGRSRRWRSFTPYAPPRHVRRQPNWMAHADAYLRRDLAAAGFPPPSLVEPVREQWLAYRRHRRKEKLADARRAVGFDVEFDEAVGGPICLGALRHFGLGLFVPVPDDG